MRLRYIAAVLLGSVLIPFSAYATTGQISFSDPTVTVGSEVNVTMKVKSGDGTLSRSEITVSYDASKLSFESGTDSDGRDGTIRINGAGSGAGTGVLEYNLKFKTGSEGSTQIKVTDQKVYDSGDAVVDIQHQGSSTVTIQPKAAVTGPTLKSLTVSPGSLSPEFSETTTEYTLSVGTDVNQLKLDAVPADSSAQVEMSGNDSLNMGENHIAITVTSADGAKRQSYTITVQKGEGGESAGSEETQPTTKEGVKLSSKEKIISIMNPGSDVTIPDGFAESTIGIDGHQVRGWVWKAESEHEYCIFYGMSEGDASPQFYRYDLKEKTLQRYFEDPLESNLRTNAENYPTLARKYDTLVNRYNVQLILSCIFGVLMIAFGFLFYNETRKTKSGKNKTARRKAASEKSLDLPEESGMEQTEHADNVEDVSVDELGVTRVIDRKEAEQLELEDLNLEDELKRTSEIPAPERKKLREKVRAKDADPKQELGKTVVLSRKDITKLKDEAKQGPERESRTKEDSSVAAEDAGTDIEFEDL